ncbi:hypothetical protein [Sulfurimonas sp.]|uniref:hypothetical protein n=1 Tax=Sulfurimonas sp. TaxID=2022749 RepID=UPI00261C95EB|nr:hypothetical protein [Sulfurimonas sp.]MDD5158284.1 hypothetical protein [Sulfurimonas sp.]
MFSMILKFQAFLERMKKNKGLWFSILTLTALLGIVGTLTYLNTMTNRAAKNLYESTNTSYFQNLDSRLTASLEKITILGTVLLDNQAFMATMNSGVGVSGQLEKIASEVNSIGKNKIEITLYNKSGATLGSSAKDINGSVELYGSKAFQQVVKTNQFISTIEYQNGAVFLKALFPLQNGILETKQSIDFLVEEYDARDKIFQVLMDKDFIDMKNVQKFAYKKIGKSEISVQEKVDEDFLEQIQDLDFDKLIKDKYILTDENFILARPILDVENKKVGVILISENILKRNGLPNMTKSISTGITTAAMGLVVALLVLMI